jgi:DNA polymerase-3 subunit delta'
MLEEPPSRAMLILLSNVPGRLLPTVRSRCQKVALRPLETPLVESELARLLPDLEPKERAALARLSGGSIGMAAQLSGSDGIMLAGEADRLLGSAARPDLAAILSLGDKVARATDGLESFGTFLHQALVERIRARAPKDNSGLDLWVDCLNAIEASFLRSEILYLEPRQTVLSTARVLATTSRRAGAL